MNTENTGSIQLPNEPQWKSNLRYKLFPPDYCDCPDAPKEYKDCVIFRSEGNISFLDRLRLLFSGRVQLDAKIVTENIVGGTVGKCTIFVKPFRWLERAE